MQESPTEALKMRFVKGEITHEQYKEMLAILIPSSGVHPPPTPAQSPPEPHKEKVNIPPVSTPKPAVITQEGINERIIKLGAEYLLPLKEIKELPSILWEDECVENILSGLYEDRSGILVATNKRLIFVDKGIFYGLRVEDFSYDKISSIQYKTGLLMGEILIYASGNKAIISHCSKPHVRGFAEYVRARITAISKHASAPTAPPAQEDAISKLERLAALRDKGILSEEEFKEQKAKILSQ